MDHKAASGKKTDIKKYEGHAVSKQMKDYNFPVRNFDGTFYEQVHLFDLSYFAIKVHPSDLSVNRQLTDTGLQADAKKNNKEF